MAARDKLRAEEERSKYEAEREDDGNHDKEDERSQGRKKRVQRDPNAPKKACNAYMWYSPSKVRELKETGLTHQEATVRAGEIWRTMTDAQKQPFEERFQQDQTRYATEKAAYEREHEGGGSSESASTANASTKTAPKNSTPSSTTSSTTTSTTPKPSSAKSSTTPSGKTSGTPSSTAAKSAKPATATSSGKPASSTANASSTKKRSAE